jgi:hypothetical protein
MIKSNFSPRERTFKAEIIFLFPDKLIFHVNLSLARRKVFYSSPPARLIISATRRRKKSFLSTLPSIFSAEHILLKEQTPKLQPLELMRKAVLMPAAFGMFGSLTFCVTLGKLQANCLGHVRIEAYTLLQIFIF